MFLQALRVAVGLALFKGGPQDMPFSMGLARASAALAVFSAALLLAPIAPLPLALATGVGGAVGVAFFTKQLLKGKKLDNRYVQTVSAQLLVGSLFALALWPAFAAMAPAMQEMMAAMRASIEAAGPDADPMATSLKITESLKTKPPTWAALWSDALFVWSLIASVRINRLAADLSMPSSWLLTFVSLLVMTGFVMLAQLIAAIFLS
ncbi:MAG: hypothetical protein Q7J29_12455 [Stagnimonas sp.]|nr:hypothetical protein [Stagnimonas sp.]